jgi:hypothetical protein
VGVGAAGHYYGAKYTDQRRKQEKRAEARCRFKKAQAQMPRLIEEMRRDLAIPKQRLYRDFCVLPKSGIPLMGRPGSILAYYENEHPNLRHAVTVLENLGYLENRGAVLARTQYPQYRITEEFAELLLEAK